MLRFIVNLFRNGEGLRNPELLAGFHALNWVKANSDN